MELFAGSNSPGCRSASTVTLTSPATSGTVTNSTEPLRLAGGFERRPCLLDAVEKQFGVDLPIGKAGGREIDLGRELVFDVHGGIGDDGAAPRRHGSARSPSPGRSRWHGPGPFARPAAGPPSSAKGPSYWRRRKTARSQPAGPRTCVAAPPATRHRGPSGRRSAAGWKSSRRACGRTQKRRIRTVCSSSVMSDLASPKTFSNAS